MKRSKSLLLTAILFISLGTTPTQADAPSTTAQPGSVDDPIITKSYFDSNIAAKVSEELGKQSINEEKVKQLIATELGKGPSTGSGGGVTVPSNINSAAAGISVVQLTPGQSLHAGAGTEVIVRTGKVTAFSSSEDGIPDVTSGKDVAAGAVIELNHQLIFPREGRGIKADAKSKAEVFVMVRGSYVVTNADGTQTTP